MTDTRIISFHQNGPNHFTNGSTLALPKEKHDEAVSSNHVEESREESDLDAGFDSIDLPEVPKVSVRSTSDIPSAPEMVPPVPSSPPHDLELDQVNKYAASEMSHVPQVEPGENKPEEASVASPYTQPDVSVASREAKQFIPFVSSPSFSSDQVSAKQTEPAPSPPVFSSVSVSSSERQCERAPLSSLSSAPLSAKKNEPASSISQINNGKGNVDLQDVLAAAQAAAETAERAAAAARAAANLAHVRITDLVTKMNNSESKGEGSHRQKDMTGKSISDHQDSFDNMNNIFESRWGLSERYLSYQEVPGMEDESPVSKERMPEHRSSSVPQRLTSFEDDPYLSYPNLFASQGSDQKIRYS